MACLATQILLDSHHIMRYSTTSAFGDLRISGFRIKKTIEDFWKLSQSHPPPTFWPKDGDQEIKRIRGSVQTWIVQDPLLEMRRTAKELGAYRDKLPENHKLFSQHGTLCGLMLFHLNLHMQIIGEGLVNQWYDVQQVAFLYNLVSRVPGMGAKWHDMEAFIKIHGEDRIFIGARPRDSIESLRRLELVSGISSVANYASNPRSRQRQHRPPGKARLLELSTTTAELFKDRYVANDMRRSVGICNIDKILDKLSQEPSPANSKDRERPNP